MQYKSLGCKKRTDSVLDTGNHDLLATKTLDAPDDDDDDDQSHNVDDEYGQDHEDDYDDWQCNGEEGDDVNDDIDCWDCKKVWDWKPWPLSCHNLGQSHIYVTLLVAF